MKTLIALAAIAQMCLAASPFHTRLDYPSGSNGFLFVTDVNGDGIPDIVESAITVYFGNGDGTFRTGPSQALPFGPFQMGDFNGDGRPDVLVMGYITHLGTGYTIGVAVAFSNGDGTFSPGTTTQLPNSPFSSQYAVIGDFNHDGNLDVVIAETAFSGEGAAYASRLVTLFGNGDGTFRAPQTTISPRLFSSNLEPSHNMIVADFNGDGYPDLAVQTMNGIQVFLNNRSGALKAGSFLPINSANPLLGMTSVDMNGDGILDMVGDLGGDLGRAFTLFGNGDGTFQEPVLSLFHGEGPAFVGDVNGDGVPDLVSVQSDGVVVAFGAPDGSFNAASTFFVGSSPYNLALSDLRGDGRLDIVSGNIFSSSVLLNEGTGKFSDTPGYSSGDPGCVAVADFNGDGHPDVALNQANGNVTVTFGTGVIDAVFSGYADSPLKQVGCAAAGDFNHDGVQDLAILVPNLDLYIDSGKGDGTFIAGPPMEMQTNGPLCTGDFNGDGNLDLAFGGGGISLGNGDGSFQLEIVLPTLPYYYSVYCGAADLNGDGITDLVETNDDPGEIYVYLGNKAAEFQYQVYSTNYNGAGPVAIADFNGDGIPDIAVSLDVSIAVLLGNGDGTFAFGPQFEDPVGTLLQASYLLAGDFDNNGTMDLAVTVPETGYIAILSGNGDGTFTLEDFLGGISPMQGAALANLHGQSPGHGGPDIVQAGGSSLAAVVDTTPIN